jgi:hypothetical protein
MMFLPENERLGGEAVALLDRVNNYDAQQLDLSALFQTRLFYVGRLRILLVPAQKGISRS